MSSTLPTLDILVSTIDGGILSVPDMLLEPIPGVRYVISMQQTEAIFAGQIPPVLESRKDVSLHLLQGRGLSLNRNNAMAHSTADICLLADDDNRYSPQQIDRLRRLWAELPETDILTFRAATYDGKPLHPYPAPYICSVEISFRRESVVGKGIIFDSRFGLGSPSLAAGEEDIFLCDCRRAGLRLDSTDETLVSTGALSTAGAFASAPKLQLTKGAVFRYMYGPLRALWLSLKESGWYLVHERRNPFPILSNMIKGIWILQ